MLSQPGLHSVILSQRNQTNMVQQPIEGWLPSYGRHSQATRSSQREELVFVQLNREGIDLRLHASTLSSTALHLTLPAPPSPSQLTNLQTCDGDVV